MNEKPELDVVELGDAKEVTKGIPYTQHIEDNPVLPERPMT